MTRVGVRAFEDADLEQAGRLLAERHAAQRKAQPLLAERYEDPAVARAEIAAVWASGDASGAVAVEGDQLTGFLLGAPKSSPVWGPNLWIEAGGHAVRDAETVRDLYGLAAARWVDEGRTAHYVLVPAYDAALVAGWFRLGFGQQHAHAIRAVPTAPEPVPAGLVIRAPRADDVDALARIDLALPEHQGLSPVFSAGTVPSVDEAREEWAEDVAAGGEGLFVAERDGRVIGAASGAPIERSSTHLGLARPDRAGLLGFAAVLPEARGQGAGQALGQAVNWWAAEQGFRSVVTDWRVTNLLSSRTWPKLGYETTFLRLHRMVGH